MFQEWMAPQIRALRGVHWSAAWFALQALVLIVVGVIERGVFAFAFSFVIGALHLYAALGLLRGIKSAWHIAAFLAFATIVLNGVAIACAPGEIADGEQHLFEAAFDVTMLAIALLVFGYLRRPEVRACYRVPLSYRIEEQ